MTDEPDIREFSFGSLSVSEVRVTLLLSLMAMECLSVCVSVCLINSEVNNKFSLFS